MSTHAFETFFALVALAANGATVGLIVVRVGACRSPALAQIRNDLGRSALPMAFGVAAITMGGSLYFSEVAHFIPCSLCWLQRTVAYPVAVVLGIAALRRDRAVGVYVIPLVLVGAAISTYHWLLERYPTLETNFCGINATCSVPWFTKFGFITLAYMAFSSFTLIAALLALPPREN